MKQDTKKLYLLLDELVQLAVKQYDTQLVSIVLFGSATTGEWVRGRSDIDCIVLIKDKDHTEQVERFLYDKLLCLDKKYDLKLSKTCTPFKKTQNLALNLVLKAERFSMFGRPFYVVSEDQIDIAKAELIRAYDLKVYIGTHVLASLMLFFHRIKSTGRVLYGRDITAEFPNTISNLEKIKASFNAVLLLMMSGVLFPIDKKTAFEHALKANFWACDNALFAMELPLSDSESSVNQIQKIFEQNGEFAEELKHLQMSLNYKKNGTNRFSKRFVARYILSSNRFVMTLYLKTIQKIFF